MSYLLDSFHSLSVCCFRTVRDLSKKLGLCPINFNDFTLDKGATNPNSLSTNNSKSVLNALDAQYEKRREKRESSRKGPSGGRRARKTRENDGYGEGGETRRRRSFKRRKSSKASGTGRSKKKSYTSKSFTKVKSESY